VIKKITTNIPRSAEIKRYSAIFSYRILRSCSPDRIEKKEKNDESASRSAIHEASALRSRSSPVLLMRIDVMTNKQNPKRFAEVARICSEVFLTMRKIYAAEVKKH